MNRNQSKAYQLLRTTNACVRKAEQRSEAAQLAAGPLLRKYREGDGVTLKQIAKILNVSIFRIWTMEEGKNLTPQLFKQFINAVDAIALHRSSNIKRYAQ